MTTNITVSANSARQAFLETADEEKVFQLSKTQLDLLATGAIGANLSIKFKLIEEFNEGAGFLLEIRKSDANGALLTSVSSADNASFSSEGELNLDLNVSDDAPYYLIVKPSSADAYSEAQFEIVFDELPTFGGLVTDNSVSSEDIVALEEAYIGTDLDNTAEFTSTSDKVSFLVDLNASDDDREIEISYGGPLTTVEVFKLSDASSASTKNITNAAGSTGITQSIGLVYTVSEESNKLTISRTDGKEFTATFAVGGDNAGVTSIPDPVISTSSSATFATALSGDASPGDIITLTLSSDNETDVTRTFTSEGAMDVNEWVDTIVDLFNEDRVTFTANAAAETIKVVFSSPANVGKFDFSINALDDPSASEEQNLASDVLLAEDQSHAPTLRINDTASSDFKMSQKVGAQINTNVTFTSESDYALADFLIVDGDFDAVYLTLEKVASENDTPALFVTVDGTTTAISTDPANPTILSKSEFLASRFTAGSSNTAEYNLTAFARKLTGQNKSEDFTSDSPVSTWFATEPNQTDSSAILQAKVNYVAASISTNILDNGGNVVSSSSSILEGEQGFVRVNVADFTKADNENTDLFINVSVSTNDISFVNPSIEGVTSKSKTQVITGATVEIPFWVVSDPDLEAMEDVVLEIELIGSESEYGQKLSSLYVKPVVFKVAELIPSLSTRYTNANALQPNDTTSAYQYEISLDNYADLKLVDDAILVKPVATSNASKFQVEAFTVEHDADNAELSIGRFAGTSDITATVSINDVVDDDAYSNGSIDATLLYSKSVKIELASSDLPTSVYAFDAPAADASDSDWSTALESAFKGFKFQAAEDPTASQVVISVYSKASTEDETSSTLIEHELTYNGKTFDSVDLSIPNVQVTTNLAITDTWTPSGTDLNDTFELNSTAASIAAGDGSDTLSVSSIPTAKSSTFDGSVGEDTVEFDDEISQFTIELSSSGDIKITDLSSSGVLYLKDTENLTFGDQSYRLTRVDGTLSSYAGESGNDLYIVSTGEPTVTDAGSGQDILITTAPYHSSKYDGIEDVYLSGDEDLTATLLSATRLHGNSGDNNVALSSEGDVIFESAGLDSITDSTADDEDIFVLVGSEASYTYYSVNDRNFITSAQGTSILSSVEKIAFSNDLNTAKPVSDLTDTAPSSEENLNGISVSVSGEHSEGSTLTATFTDTSKGQAIALSENFSWYEVGSSAVLKSGNTLTLTADDIGKTIYSKVSYLDADGTLRSVTSAETRVDYFNDPMTGIVSLAGSMAVGGRIAPDVLTFSDLDFAANVIPSISSYQWYQNGEIIEGADQRELEITQSLKNEELSVKVGFENSYGDIEYLTSSDSRLVFEGRDRAALSVNENDLFSVNSGSAAISQSFGTIKSKFSSFFSGDEVAQYADSISQTPNLDSSFDSLDIEVKTSSSVISDPDTAQNFTVLGNENTNNNLALFIDLTEAADGAKVEATDAQNIFLKGNVSISTDETRQAIFADSSAQVITTGEGDDVIFSGEGDDTISAGEGLNIVNAGSGSDTIYINFDYDASHLAYDNTREVLIYNNGEHAVNVSDAETFIFKNDEKTIADLQSLENKDFVALGKISLIGSARSGAELEIVDETFDSNGVDLETIAFEWLRDGQLIEGATSKFYTLTDDDIGATIVAQMSFDDSFGNTSSFVSASLENIGSKRAERTGTSGNDIFTSKAENELFKGKAGGDLFKFKRKDQSSQGDDAISDYDPLEDKLEFSDYDYSKITRTLDAAGNDYFEFNEDPGESSLTIENATGVTQLKVRNLVDKILKIENDSLIDLTIDQNGGMGVSEKTDIQEVKIDGISDFSKQLSKSSGEKPSTPIDLGDVLAQLKHMSGQAKYKLSGTALAAGDLDSDGDVDLADVLVILKHLSGQEKYKIDTFDLVTDNGFAVNALNPDSIGNLTLVINGDADQSHENWEIYS